MTIAQTTLAQLGGNKFAAMTGAKHFVADGAALNFKLPQGFAAKRINFVRVELTPADTYTVTFSNYRALTLREIARHEGVYADQLRALFTAETGLETSL